MVVAIVGQKGEGRSGHVTGQRYRCAEGRSPKGDNTTLGEGWTGVAYSPCVSWSMLRHTTAHGSCRVNDVVDVIIDWEKVDRRMCAAPLNITHVHVQAVFFLPSSALDSASNVHGWSLQERKLACHVQDMVFPLSATDRVARNMQRKEAFGIEDQELEKLICVVWLVAKSEQHHRHSGDFLNIAKHAKGIDGAGFLLT